MKDILYFIDNYVPKRLYDLELAGEQHIAFFKAVQKGATNNGPRRFAIRAPRKGAKTILVAIAAVWLTLRDVTFRFFILSGSQNQAQWLYDYCKAILWPSGPEGARIRSFFGQFLDGEPKATITRYKERGWIMYTAASSKQVNAPTADAVAMDEYVLIPENIVQEAWPMNRQSTNLWRFLLSTATSNKTNTDSFLDILEACEPGEELYKQGWRKFEWETKDCPHLQTKAAIEDAEGAKFFLTDDMFHTQYEGGLPKRAGRIFPKTFIREAFVAPDPDNPGFLLDGSPYDPDNLEFQGDTGGGIDWGFDHDTVILEGYRGLDHKMHLMKMIIGNGTSASDWGQTIEDDALEHHIEEWYADAAGAFQNQEIKNRGFRVVARAFGSQSRGKEWMIGIAYWWLQRRMVVIPDTPEFAPLKKQLQKWKRGADGKPVKVNDHCCDSFICWLSKWDPRYYEEGEERKGQPQVNEINVPSANDWRNFNSEKNSWLPEHWRENEILRKEPWQ
jgi:hypothetical protein